MAKLVILSGPSCVGKSPLLKALQRFYPELSSDLRPLVLFNDRAPRPGELDGVAYHFRSRESIQALAEDPGYIVLPVRKDLQALEIAQVLEVLAAGATPFFEGNAYIAEALLNIPKLADVPRQTVFLAPLSLEEMQYLKAQPDVNLEMIVAEVMRQKLQRRTEKHKGTLSEQDLVDIEARSGAAYREMRYAPGFEWVLPTHDGEDSENWSAFGYPIGDARRCLLDFAAILQGQEPRWAEKWPAEVFDDSP